MTPLEKTLKRELSIDGQTFIVAISPEGIKLTLKGKRNGQELKWKDLVSGDAALAVALNASLGGFAARPAPARATAPTAAARRIVKPPAAKQSARKPSVAKWATVSPSVPRARRRPSR